MTPSLAQAETSGLVRDTAMPARRVLRAYALEAKYESLRMLRAPAFAGPFLALPVGLYLLFAVLLFGAEIGKDPGAALFTFMGFCVLGVMGTMVAAAPLGHLRLGAIQMLSVSLVNIAGALPFCALGFLVGALASAKAAPAFVNLLYLPMIYLSAILFPLPKSLHWVALFSPAYHLDQLGLASMGFSSDGMPLVHLLVLAGATLVFTALALRRLARVG